MPSRPSPGHASPPAPAVEIRVEDLRKSFNGRVVLDGISTEVRSGEIVAIVGASGSGKTVFLDHLIGLLSPDSGRVMVADHDAPRPLWQEGRPPLIDLGSLGDEELDRVRLRWAVVFQRNALFSGTVRENIALWLGEHTDLDERRIEQRVRKSLEAAQLEVDDVIDKSRDALSGGMAKRVAIARAIAIDPLVIFYDEPTTGLDPVVGGHIHELIWRVHHLPVGELFDDPGSSAADVDEQGLAREGEQAGQARRARARRGRARTSIIVTHDKDLLRRIRPRVLMLDQGRVVFDGPYDRFGTPGPDGGGEVAERYLASMPVLHARPSL